MKLLLLTQRVNKNDPELGFFHRWIIEFAKHAKQITVICLEEGAHELPANVKVLSLGKEKKQSRLMYISHFYRYIWHERKNYDAVFVHMNPVYILLGGLFWHMWGKRIGLWYVHKNVDLKLRIAVLFADLIFTASPESIHIKSKKVCAVGHGIDTKEFFFRSEQRSGAIPCIVSVGRITPIKDYKTLLEALVILKEKSVVFEALVVGAPATREDIIYLEMLERLVRKLGLEDNVRFSGAVPHTNVVELLHDASLFVNMSHTGSLDKAVLEAMACGTIPLTCNKAFIPMLRSHDLIWRVNDPADLAEKIEHILLRADSVPLVKELRGIIERDHELTGLIKKIIRAYETSGERSL